MNTEVTERAAERKASVVAIHGYKDLFNQTLSSGAMPDTNRDMLCTAIAHVTLDLGVPDEIIVRNEGDPPRRARLALEFIDLIEKSNAEIALLPNTTALLWKAIVWGFIRGRYNEKECAWYLAHFSSQDKNVRQLFEKVLRDEIKRFSAGHAIYSRGYEMFFAESPENPDHSYPGVKVILQEFTRTYPSVVIKGLKAWAASMS